MKADIAGVDRMDFPGTEKSFDPEHFAVFWVSSDPDAVMHPNIALSQTRDTREIIIGELVCTRAAFG